MRFGHACTKLSAAVFDGNFSRKGILLELLELQY